MGGITMDTRNMFDLASEAGGSEYDKLQKEWWRVRNEEYFVDKHFDVIFALSCIIPLSVFAILCVITKSLGLAFMSAFICVVIFFGVIIFGKIMFKADKIGRLREIEDKLNKL